MSAVLFMLYYQTLVLLFVSPLLRRLRDKVRDRFREVGRFIGWLKVYAGLAVWKGQ